MVMKDAREFVGDDFPNALAHMESVMESMQRNMSAILLMQFPNRACLERELEHLCSVLLADRVQVNVVTDHEQVIVAALPDLEDGAPTRIPNRDSVCVLPVGTGEAMAVDNLRKNPLTADRAVSREWLSWASAPIEVQGCWAGTVSAMDKEPRVWRKVDETRLRESADVIGHAVDRWIEEGKRTNGPDSGEEG